MEWPQQLVEASVTGGLVALCLWFRRVELGREQARDALAAASSPARLKRAASDLTPGPALLRVQVAGAEGAWINLGTSHESYESLSANPTLDGLGSSMLTEDGRPLSLSPGAPLDIQKVYGARRNVLESITKPGGVVHLFSFEVLSGTWLWLRGRLAEEAAPGTPFRAGAARRIEPMGKAYVLYGEEPTLPTSSSGAGCWIVLVIVTLLASVVPILLSSTEAWTWVTVVAVILAIGGVWLLPERPAAPTGE
jgi:hypothetical protein